MSVSEQALIFPCAGEQLFGVLAQPQNSLDTGVLIVVGGPQTRVGSHRQFLLLSRHLAKAGYPVLRFDCRGMGDSTGEQRSFESFDDDIGAAIDTLFENCPGLKRVVLWGLCDGASAALLYWQATRDSRIAGFCLLNPWVRSESTLARTQVKHYYGQRLMQREFWLKLASGKLNLVSAISGLLGKLRQSVAAPAPNASVAMGFQERMIQALSEHGGQTLLILSGNDHTAKEFLEYASTSGTLAACLRAPHVRRADVPEADHTFSTALWRREVEKLTVEWLQCFRSCA